MAADHTDLPMKVKHPLSHDAGQTHLILEEEKQVGVIPRCGELFAFDAAPFGFLAFE
jgi:hypothetical protein